MPKRSNRNDATAAPPTPEVGREGGRGTAGARARQAGTDTGDYSATKAPENREHVESTAPGQNPSQKPGGPHGVARDVGMSALHRNTVPRLAADAEQADRPDNPATDDNAGGTDKASHQR